MSCHGLRISWTARAHREQRSLRRPAGPRVQRLAEEALPWSAGWTPKCREERAKREFHKRVVGRGDGEVSRTCVSQSRRRCPRSPTRRLTASSRSPAHSARHCSCRSACDCRSLPRPGFRLDRPRAQRQTRRASPRHSSQARQAGSSGRQHRPRGRRERPAPPQGRVRTAPCSRSGSGGAGRSRPGPRTSPGRWRAAPGLGTPLIQGPLRSIRTRCWMASEPRRRRCSQRKPSMRSLRRKRGQRPDRCPDRHQKCPPGCR